MWGVCGRVVRAHVISANPRSGPVKLGRARVRNDDRETDSQRGGQGMGGDRGRRPLGMGLLDQAHRVPPCLGGGARGQEVGRWDRVQDRHRLVRLREGYVGRNIDAPEVWGPSVRIPVPGKRYVF